MSIPFESRGIHFTPLGWGMIVGIPLLAGATALGLNAFHTDDPERVSSSKFAIDLYTSCSLPNTDFYNRINPPEGKLKRSVYLDIDPKTGFTVVGVLNKEVASRAITTSNTDELSLKTGYIGADGEYDVYAATLIEAGNPNQTQEEVNHIRASRKCNFMAMKEMLRDKLSFAQKVLEVLTHDPIIASKTKGI